MAVPTVTVNGKVVTPSGAAVTSGSLKIELSRPATVTDPVGGEKERVGGIQTAAIGSDGSVNFPIVPNDVIVLDGNSSPGGTRYIVTFSVVTPVRATWVEYWNVKTAPNPVAIGAIEREIDKSSLTLGRAVSKAITVESPQANDFYPICQVDRLVSLDHVTAAIAKGGAGATVTFQIKHGPSFPLAYNLWGANKTCDTSASGQKFADPFNDATLAADEFLGLSIVSVSGQVDEFNVTIFYLE